MDPETNKENEIKKRFSDITQLNELQLANEIIKLESGKKISALGFIRFIACFDFLDDTLVIFISRGITRHFNQDYVSSIHVLIPQIEGILKALLLYKKIQVPSKFSETDENITESLLHTLLRNPKVEQFLGKDFTKYLELKFTDRLGLNLRNRVSHALIDSVLRCNHQTSYSLIHVILMLLRKSL